MIPATLDASGVPFLLRRARRDDLGALVALLSADALRANDDSDARSRGAALVQLTSDARREGAHRFYGRLGFSPSHVGFKLFL